MTRKSAYIIATLVLLPIVVGLTVIVIDAAGGGVIRSGARKIGVVRIDDIITSARRPIEDLRAFEIDPQVAAIVIRLNSPGGAVGPSQEIYSEVLRIRDAGDKPVITSMDNLAASGAYYIASASQRIFANPGTLTGSIGVVMQLSRVKGLFSKIGVEVETVKSGTFKDVGNPYRDMTREERAHVQGVIDDTYEQFLEDVAAGRKIALDTLRKLADGRIYTGRQALAVGLVDTLGGMEQTLAYARTLADLPIAAKVIERKTRSRFWQSLLPEGILRKTGIALERTFYPGGIYYLYEGG